jgi:serine/tyrosine/threonine adenylyltransferase
MYTGVTERPVKRQNRLLGGFPPTQAGMTKSGWAFSETAIIGSVEPIMHAEATSIFPFDNSYARLPENFYARQNPTAIAAPRLIRLNDKLARHLNLDPELLASPQGIEVLSGNRVPERAEPLAMAYAGHQFGTFVPQLGDGRAILLGELTGRDGIRRDVQLKGSGLTPFSRGGDGRAVLGPVLREYIVSEAMAALGIPTTRALAAVTTGETVWRERPLPGAVLTRVASSHIRVGTFQYFAARGDTEAVRKLADYAIGRHYPKAAEAPNPYLALLEQAIARQVNLIAQWMMVGFIHGVMNTDNMSVAGETIDYGPCAFMDSYHPETVYSSIDAMGRYAYGNQPRIGQWNLARLAETLLPLLNEDPDKAVEHAQRAIGTFVPLFEAAYLIGFRRKLGLLQPDEGDVPLVNELLAAMAANGADFTLTFRRLCGAILKPDRDAANSDGDVLELFADRAAFGQWLSRWRDRLNSEGGDQNARLALMRAANPAFIPRNHLVEEAIAAAQNEDDFGPFERLLTVLATPYEDQPGFERYMAPPRSDQIVRQTFCGT